jgi:hypothetical protein
MQIIRIPIIESKQGSQAKLFSKLSYPAKKLFVAISKLNKSTDNISLNDIRNLNMFGTTSEIKQLLYTLESRGFGEVKINGAEIYFIPNKVFAISI